MSLSYDCRHRDIREAGIDAATSALKSGQLVVFPTDTVYGLGCDAFSYDGVQGLLSAKERDRGMPVPVLVGSWETIDGLALMVSPATRTLIQAFWPGALSVIVVAAPSLAWDLGDTSGTVMVRMPLHPIALELLRRIGPMAVSSANISGKPPAKTADEAREQLADRVSVYLDGGPAMHGVASTIVDMTGSKPQIRRVGAVPAAAIAHALGIDEDELSV